MVLTHPVVGKLELTYESLLLPGDPQQYRLIVFTAHAGTRSHAALLRLAKVLTQLDKQDGNTPQRLASRTGDDGIVTR